MLLNVFVAIVAISILLLYGRLLHCLLYPGLRRQLARTSESAHRGGSDHPDPAGPADKEEE